MVGLSIAKSAASINVVCYLIVFPLNLYQKIEVYDMRLQGIWLTRLITELIIGSMYELMVYTTDIEEVIWHNRERMAGLDQEGVFESTFI